MFYDLKKLLEESKAQVGGGRGYRRLQGVDLWFVKPRAFTPFVCVCVSALTCSYICACPDSARVVPPCRLQTSARRLPATQHNTCAAKPHNRPPAPRFPPSSRAMRRPSRSRAASLKSATPCSLQKSDRGDHPFCGCAEQHHAAQSGSVFKQRPPPKRPRGRRARGRRRPGAPGRLCFCILLLRPHDLPPRFQAPRAGQAGSRAAAAAARLPSAARRQCQGPFSRVLVSLPRVRSRDAPFPPPALPLPRTCLAQLRPHQCSRFTPAPPAGAGVPGPFRTRALEARERAKCASAPACKGTHRQRSARRTGEANRELGRVQRGFAALRAPAGSSGQPAPGEAFEALGGSGAGREAARGARAHFGVCA